MYNNAMGEYLWVLNTKCIMLPVKSPTLFKKNIYNNSVFSTSESWIFVF